MDMPICLFLSVLVISIAVIIVQVIEHYPEWCTYYEYKEKARQFDNLKEQYNNDVKELSKTIDNFKRFIGKEYRAAFEYRNDIGHIKNIIKLNNSTTKAIEEIKKYLNSIGL